mmetsp:Transcript_13328/g.37723  ORF Transcript_13328/g.37723 Transcript_13328/m.37723 type:complete len:259 (+) Transcript_13328:777-1553(+)
MMTPSSCLPSSATRLRMPLSPLMRSPRTVQQIQPLFISMICSTPSSSRSVLEAISASSTPTSPNSFSITANTFPCEPRRMWLSRVVLPLPKKPVSMWAGTLPCASTRSFSRKPSSWASWSRRHSSCRSITLPSPGANAAAAASSAALRRSPPRLIRMSARDAYRAASARADSAGSDALAPCTNRAGSVSSRPGSPAGAGASPRSKASRAALISCTASKKRPDAHAACASSCFCRHGSPSHASAPGAITSAAPGCRHTP